MNSIYFKTFARVCLLPYIGGAISQILRLIYNVNNDLMPKQVSWIVIAIGLYVVPGLIIFANKISFKNNWDKFAYGLVTFQLTGGVIVHSYILFTKNTSVLHAFPHRYWYSFIAVGYFLTMGIYVYSLNKRLYQKG